MPERRYNRSVQLTSFGSDVDLTGQSGMPLLQPALRLEVHNDASTTQDIVLTMKGQTTNTTFEIPADSVRVIDDVEVTAIVASGTETIASVNAYYRFESGPTNA